MFVNYLNNILFLIFQYYFENKFTNDSMIYKCLENKIFIIDIYIEIKTLIYPYIYIFFSLIYYEL